jgi:hypothetical protein
MLLPAYKAFYGKKLLKNFCKNHPSAVLVLRTSEILLDKIYA